MTVQDLTENYEGLIEVHDSTTGDYDFTCLGGSEVLQLVKDYDVVSWESFTSTMKRGIIIKIKLTEPATTPAEGGTTPSEGNGGTTPSGSEGGTTPTPTTPSQGE